MNNRFSRIRKAWNVLTGQSSGVDMDLLQQQLDEVVERKQANQTKSYPTVQKARPKKPKSKLDIRTTNRDLAFVSTWYDYIFNFASRMEEAPRYDDPARDAWLDNLWKEEPILAGAVYSMTAKMTALKWSITGRRRVATQAAELLSRAASMAGYDWGGFISSTANDYYTVNRGVFWETARIGGRIAGRLADIGHIDALACTLTGNSKYPVYYNSFATGQTLRFRPGEYIHFASLPSPREELLGMGFCAVDRANRAAKLLLGLHDYDDEKLANLPPEGVAAITGLTLDEVNDAMKLWKIARESDKSLTYPQVLWLAGSQPNVDVNVDFVGFSQIPESFDRESVVRHYVATLALDFGVDAREFWPISSGSLGTAAESEIQHLKAKGKGPGEFISTTERHVNGELPNDADFGFDTQDIEEDANAAAVTQAWVSALFPLTTAGGAVEEILTRENFLRMLADRDIIPDYMVDDSRVAISDSDIHKQFRSEGHGEDFTKIVWHKGILKEVRLPPIIVNSTYQPDHKVPDAILEEKGVSDAPNYRPSETSEKCSNCEYFKNGKWCEKFDFTADPGYVCDAWEIAPAWDVSEKSNGHHSTEELLVLLKQREEEILSQHRNIRGEPIPEREVIRGSSVTRNTIASELERWRKHPILSKYVPDESEEEAIVAEITNSA